MTSMTHRLPFAALALLGALGSGIAPALAQIEVTQQGENFAVSYDPAHTGNVVGGGAVQVTGRGENIGIRHVDPDYAFAAPGIPVDLGGGRESRIVRVAPRNGAATSVAEAARPDDAS